MVLFMLVDAAALDELAEVTALLAAATMLSVDAAYSHTWLVTTWVWTVTESTNVKDSTSNLTYQ